MYVRATADDVVDRGVSISVSSVPVDCLLCGSFVESTLLWASLVSAFLLVSLEDARERAIFSTLYQQDWHVLGTSKDDTYVTL